MVKTFLVRRESLSGVVLVCQEHQNPKRESWRSEETSEQLNPLCERPASSSYTQMADAKAGVVTDRNTSYTAVDIAENSLQTNMTDDGRVVENWVNEQTGQETVGFDPEWRPNFQYGWGNEETSEQRPNFQYGWENEEPSEQRPNFQYGWENEETSEQRANFQKGWEDEETSEQLNPLSSRPDSSSYTQMEEAEEGLVTDRNTSYIAVDFANKSIQTIVTDDGRVVENWVNEQTGQEIVGFDLEWRPNFQKGCENDTALLQLCTDNGCLIIQMLFLDFIPEALVRFLKDPGVKLVGVSIDSDVTKLLCDQSLECGGQVELRALAAEKLGRRELKQAGLKGLAMEVLGLRLSKPKSISMSNWAWRFLQQRQIKYACIDAYVSLAIGKRLLEPEN